VRFFGHPRGLSTLFFTEMWEALQLLRDARAAHPVHDRRARGGWVGLRRGHGGAIYGLYTSMLYMMTLPGGWIADRLIGPQRAVIVGGVLIASGHFSWRSPR
jgi:POT family proton-dependent oligopeptide transporter